MQPSQWPYDWTRHSKRAQAVILKRWETGIVFDGNPQMGLLLEVQPVGQEPFQAEVKTVVARMHMQYLQPGAVLQVSFDPENLRRVAIAALRGSDGDPGA